MLAQDVTVKDGMVRTKDSLMECPYCKSTFQKDHSRTRMKKWGKDQQSFYTTRHCPNCDKRITLRDDNPDVESIERRMSKLRTYCNYCKMNGQFDEYRDAMGEVLELQKQIEDMRNEKMKSKVKDATNYNGERSFQTYEAWKRACRQIDPNVKFDGDIDICQAGKVGEWDGDKGIIYNTKDSKKHMKDAASVALKGLCEVRKQMKDDFGKQKSRGWNKEGWWVVQDLEKNQTTIYDGHNKVVVTFPGSDLDAVGKVNDWISKHPFSTMHDKKTKDQDNIKEKLIAFFKENPNPDDDKVHAFAEQNGIDPYELEEEIYKIVTEHVGMVKDDDYKRMSLVELQKKAKEGYFELQSDPKPRNHVEIKYPNGKKEWVFVEDSKPTAKDKLLKGLDSLKRRMKDAFGMNIEEQQKQFDTRNIEKESIKNNAFRKVIFTGNTLQLVLMSLLPNEDIGMEVHDKVDQFFRVEEGEGLLEIKDQGTYPLKAGSSMLVTAGTQHNVINNGSEPLKLYTLYGPPNHPADRLQNTKAEAVEAEKATKDEGNFLVGKRIIVNAGRFTNAPATVIEIGGQVTHGVNGVYAKMDTGEKVWIARPDFEFKDSKTKDVNPADSIKNLLQKGYSLKEAILETEKSIGRQLNAFEAAEAVAVSKKMGKTKDVQETAESLFRQFKNNHLLDDRREYDVEDFVRK